GLDRRRSHVDVAGYRDDGKVHIEVVASRAGVDWLQGWLAQRAKKYSGMSVALQGKGAPISTQAEVLEDVEGVTVTPWQGADLPNGTGLFYDAVCNNEVFHVPQHSLDRDANQAVIKVLGGDVWVFDRYRSPIDVAPLQAAIAAYWNLTRKQVAPRRSAYEDHGLVVV